MKAVIEQVISIANCEPTAPEMTAGKVFYAVLDVPVS
jgi:hypothetical protein